MNNNFPDSFTWWDSIGKTQGLINQNTFDFKMLCLTRNNDKEASKEEGVKKGNTPMECDLKGLFKITVEETKLKENFQEQENI